MYWDNVVKEALDKKSSKPKKVFTNLSTVQNKQVPHNKKFSRCKKRKQYPLGEKHKDTYFTSREAECMLLLLQGKTIKGVARILELSPRTVEFYVKNMRIKLKCSDKNRLIQTVLESDFLKKIS